MLIVVFRARSGLPKPLLSRCFVIIIGGGRYAGCGDV
jgi:hypothetical protein